MATSGNTTQRDNATTIKTNIALLMVLNATFNNISLYRGGQIYWWRKA